MEGVEFGVALLGWAGTSRDSIQGPRRVRVAAATRLSLAGCASSRGQAQLWVCLCVKQAQPGAASTASSRWGGIFCPAELVLAGSSRTAAGGADPPDVSAPHPRLAAHLVTPQLPQFPACPGGRGGGGGCSSRSPILLGELAQRPWGGTGQDGVAGSSAGDPPPPQPRRVRSVSAAAPARPARLSRLEPCWTR